MIKNTVFPEIIELVRFSYKSFKSIKRRHNGYHAFKQLSLSSVKLEFGSGSKRGTSGWTTIDLAPDADIEWDILNSLPLSNDSVDIIYSSHLLEHLSYKEIIAVLHDWFRVLKPEGKLMVCVPDASHYISAYYNSDTIKPFVPNFYKPAFNYQTPIDYLNYMAYMDGEHKHLFDEKNLHTILESVGFMNVRNRPFNPNLDSEGHDWESIYAEAEKP